MVKISKMSDSLFPEVLRELTYSLRVEQGVGIKGFLDGSGLVSVVLICWGQEGVFWEGEEEQQFLALCLVFLYLKQCPSFVHLQ